MSVNSNAGGFQERQRLYAIFKSRIGRPMSAQEAQRYYLRTGDKAAAFAMFKSGQRVSAQLLQMLYAEPQTTIPAANLHGAR